jgi:adenosylcobyric acid synthase
MRYGKLNRPIMVAGTGSDVGKSIIAAGLCRVFKQDGYSPAPFKSQNMSLNSFVTLEGGEIGRAQAAQAEACGIPCHTDMNPVLLKPTSDKCAQIVLHGRPVGTQSAAEYFLGEDKAALFSQAKEAFYRLSSKHMPIVIEGAGSISELNLKTKDIANMRMAAAAGADVYLVADISRGGVFGSVYGSLQLLEPSERKLVKGIIVNKFRGDIGLFAGGRKILEDICGIPVTGVVPHLGSLYIDKEDSVSLEDKPRTCCSGKVNIAVVLLGRIANFTDFAPLELMPDVHLFYTDSLSELEKADAIILPGSKNTIADLELMWENGLASCVIGQAAKGKPIAGICGGYQIMGREVRDPLMLDKGSLSCKGLGLLPVETENYESKITIQRQFSFKNSSQCCYGYEIHMGRTFVDAGAEKPLAILSNGQPDGYMASANCWGTYLHGIFDNACVLADFLSPFGDRIKTKATDFREFKSAQYDILAAELRASLDISAIYQQLSSTDA